MTGEKKKGYVRTHEASQKRKDERVEIERTRRMYALVVTSLFLLLLSQ